ncbi:intraflagellar transport protein 43 homolog A isoform X2 [Macrobrachium rosenbergii]|uniref:intraflagellar transport protein 43 homolog A isoform X2 n=1 Tax=Macrobrachium rosenbergii TaxID=79674 RepID=UPI0034D68685
MKKHSTAETKSEVNHVKTSKTIERKERDSEMMAVLKWFLKRKQQLHPNHVKFFQVSPRKGRRAGVVNSGPDSLGDADDLLSSPSRSAAATPRNGVTTGPPAGRRAGGWASSAKAGGFGPPVEDSRFRRNSDSDNDMPVIPDLEEVVEEDFTQQVAQAPSIAVNRVATYKELDSDLLRHAAFSTLDDIDLRILTNCLANEADIREPDIEWKWDTIFTEISSELRNEWDPNEEPSETNTKSPELS